MELLGRTAFFAIDPFDSSCSSFPCVSLAKPIVFKPQHTVFRSSAFDGALETEPDITMRATKSVAFRNLATDLLLKSRLDLNDEPLKVVVEIVEAWALGW